MWLEIYETKHIVGVMYHKYNKLKLENKITKMTKKHI